MIILAKDVAGIMFKELQDAVRSTMPGASEQEICDAELSLLVALGAIKG